MRVLRLQEQDGQMAAQLPKHIMHMPCLQASGTRITYEHTVTTLL